ncbi:hypothetical protein Tcan_12994 [Toxocara canis]|uniref:Domain of unknown function DB domain-containing protein n=1 Tax=Toxocara canis TaxID=6265 RepID=A0A0B2UU24_TOXCA|nr:hypothetical protein Tcan_12994 [Toxocara canis]
MRLRGYHFSTAVILVAACLVEADLPSCERAKCHHCRVDFIAKMCPTSCEPCPKPIPGPSKDKFAQAKRIVLAASAKSEVVEAEKTRTLQPLPYSNSAHGILQRVSPKPLPTHDELEPSADVVETKPLPLSQQQSQRVDRTRVTKAPRTASSEVSNARKFILDPESTRNEQHRKLQQIAPTQLPQQQQQPPIRQQRFKQQGTPTQQYQKPVPQRNLQQPEPQLHPQPHSQLRPQLTAQQLPVQPSQAVQYQQNRPSSSPIAVLGAQPAAQTQQSPAFNPFQPFLSQSFGALSPTTSAPIFNPFTFPTFVPMTFPPITPPAVSQQGFQAVRFPQAPTLLPPPMQLPNFNQAQLPFSPPQIPPPPPPPLPLLGQLPTDHNRHVSQQVQPQPQPQLQLQSQPPLKLQQPYHQQQLQQPSYAQQRDAQLNYQPQPASQVPQQRQSQSAFSAQPAVAQFTQNALNQQQTAALNPPQLAQLALAASQQHFTATQPPLPPPQPIAAPIEASIDAAGTQIEKAFYATGKETPIPIKQCPRQPNWEPCISKEVANERFRSCCQRLGEGCATLCNYDATLTTIQLGVLTGRCPISKVADMMICASGYEDATPCCQAYNVFEPGFEHCRPYCNPAAGLPQGGMLSEQYKCLGKLSQIQRCFYVSQRP